MRRGPTLSFPTDSALKYITHSPNSGTSLLESLPLSLLCAVFPCSLAPRRMPNQPWYTVVAPVDPLPKARLQSVHHHLDLPLDPLDPILYHSIALVFPASDRSIPTSSPHHPPINLSLMSFLPVRKMGQFRPVCTARAQILASPSMPDPTRTPKPG